MTYHTFYIDSASFLSFAASLGAHLSSLAPDPQGLPFAISIPGIDCEKLDLAGKKARPEVEVFDLIVVGQESPPESETLALVAAGKSSSPECEMLEVVGKRTSPDIETPVLATSSVIERLELAVVGMGISPVIETLEVTVVGMGTSPVIDTLIEIGQIKQGKQQARHHLLQCLLWKPEFWHSDVCKSPPHPHDFQASGTRFFSVIICFECIFY